MRLESAVKGCQRGKTRIYCNGQYWNAIVARVCQGAFDVFEPLGFDVAWIDGGRGGGLRRGQLKIEGNRYRLLWLRPPPALAA